MFKKIFHCVGFLFFLKFAANQQLLDEMCNKYKGVICGSEIVYNVNGESRWSDLSKRYGFRFHVVGGIKAEPKQYPHMALIGYGNGSNIQWICGGSLISERFVLSVGHCVSPPGIGDARWVRLGDLNVDTTKDDATPMEYEIVQRIPHPQYKHPSVYNDIALFKLDRDVEFNEYIRPICLSTNETIDGKIPLTATGWGKTGLGEITSPALLTVDLDIIANEKCATVYGTSVKFTNGIDSKSMICASKDGKDTCSGDSGGPFQQAIWRCKFTSTYSYSQVGITSFGNGCADPNFPGVYTRISHYIPWIEKMISE